MKKTIILAAAAMMACAANANQQFNASSVANTAQQVANATATAATVATTIENTKNGTSTLSASEAGKAAGTSLAALYKQYKADGKFDYKNITNYTQTVNLLNYCAELPTNIKNTEYLKEFGEGLIASTEGLVTPINVSEVTNSLTTLASQYAGKAKDAVNSAKESASTATSSASGMLSTTASAASSLSTLLASLGK